MFIIYIVLDTFHTTPVLKALTNRKVYNVISFFHQMCCNTVKSYTVRYRTIFSIHLFLITLLLCEIHVCLLELWSLSTKSSDFSLLSLFTCMLGRLEIVFYMDIIYFFLSSDTQYLVTCLSFVRLTLSLSYFCEKLSFFFLQPLCFLRDEVTCFFLLSVWTCVVFVLMDGQTDIYYSHINLEVLWLIHNHTAIYH